VSSETAREPRRDALGLSASIADGIFVLLRYGEAERPRRELEQASTLSIFGFRDHGALLKIALLPSWLRSMSTFWSL
jgi:hypothetical protein